MVAPKFKQETKMNIRILTAGALALTVLAGSAIAADRDHGGKSAPYTGGTSLTCGAGQIANLGSNSCDPLKPTSLAKVHKTFLNLLSNNIVTGTGGSGTPSSTMKFQS